MIGHLDALAEELGALLQLICTLDDLVVLVHLALELLNAIRLQLVALVQLRDQLVVLRAAVDEADHNGGRCADQRGNDNIRHPRLTSRQRRRSSAGRRSSPAARHT